MTSQLLGHHEGVVIDACCLINLYASGYAAEIMTAVPGAIATSVYVRAEEARRIYSGPMEGIKPPDELIDLIPLIDQRLLQILDLESEDEKVSFVTFSAKVDRGEAEVASIALHRNWAIGTDDRAAIRLFTEALPNLERISTLQFLKNWEDHHSPAPAQIAQALHNIRVRAHYMPGKGHPLRTWWDERLQAAPGENP